MSDPLVHGEVAPGYEPVRAAFVENFRSRGEIGAAACAYVDGAKVFDLWGGIRNTATGQPWERDTMVVVFSTTKGLSALPLALLHSRGLLDFDEPVATYWPEFAAGGKAAITIRQLLCHQAGLCAVAERVTFRHLEDPVAMAELMARQRPAWEPGTRQGYHGLTIGWFEAELVRRIDPKGRSLGTFLQEEICGPLGVEFYVGLPESVPDERLANLVDYAPWRALFHMGDLPWRFVLGVLTPGAFPYQALRNPSFGRLRDWGTRRVLRLEIPAGNGVGEVRAVARAYSELATESLTLGFGPETLAALRDPAPQAREGNYDAVLHLKTLYSLGFAKPGPRRKWLTSAASFGAFGAGGSFGFADPEARVGYAYAPNKLGFKVWDDPREHALRDALYRCLAAAGRAPSPDEIKAGWVE